MLTASRSILAGLLACARACVCGRVDEQARMALVHYKTPILLETIIHLMLSFSLLCSAVFIYETISL